MTVATPAIILLTFSTSTVFHLFLFNLSVSLGNVNSIHLVLPNLGLGFLIGGYNTFKGTLIFYMYGPTPDILFNVFYHLFLFFFFLPFV